jgi:ribonuclease HI
VKTNLGIHWIEEAAFRLKNKGYEIHFMWIPAHSGIRGNEKVDTIAKNSSLETNFANTRTIPFDYYP